jgi:C1A family cysteine protease
MSRHVYGWRRPLPGLTYPTADTESLQILAEVDPRKHLPPVFNQLALGSCTANATAACFQYDAILDGKDCGALSRLWIYYFERAIEHTLDQGDAGAMGHDAFTVAKHGIPDESLWPYDIERFEAKPPDAEPRAYTLRRTVRAVPQTLAAVKQVLSNRQTIAFGFTVYESFESQWTQPGVMPIPKRGEEVLGGHEVLIVGYLKAHPEYALVRNSWGSGWGLAGYLLFPWKLLLDSQFASDFRTIVRPL